MGRWYVIQTKPRREDEVARRIGLADIADAEVLNPKIRSFSRGLQPLFPNYIFLRWDLFKAHNYHMIKYTRGVNRILGIPEYPVPVPDEVIEIIRERISPEKVLEQETYEVGTYVKIRRGLLKELVGVLEKPVSADGRVTVLLRIHEREMRAVLGCRDVSLVA